MSVSPLPFSFACPSCRAELARSDLNELRCLEEGLIFPRINGVWRCLLPEAQERYRRFIEEYTAVRRAEGRGSVDPAYYRALPFDDLSGLRSADWRIRARSYRALEARLPRLEGSRKSPVRALDLGAGNGWLSHRLALRDYRVAAVDLLVDPFDGLGVFRHYKVDFTPVQAEFDRLPFTPEQVDLVVFNAALHYSTDYSRTLREALRVLQPEGWLAILDSPLYHQASSGREMVREREAEYTRCYGFPSNALDSENFLTYDRLEQLSAELGLRWELFTPFYGLGWALRPWLARLRGRREPAKFRLIVGKRA